MMSTPNRLGPGLRIAFIALASAAVWAGLPERGPGSEREPLLVPFIVDQARALRTVEAQVLVYNSDDSQPPISLRALRVLAEGEVLYERALERELRAPQRPDRTSAARSDRARA